MWLLLLQTLNSNRPKKRTVPQIPCDYPVTACINYLNSTFVQRQHLTPMKEKTFGETTSKYRQYILLHGHFVLKLLDQEKGHFVISGFTNSPVDLHGPLLVDLF